MGEERFLHCSGIDGQPPAHDHSLWSIVHVVVAVGAAAGHVSGTKPAIAQHGGGVVRAAEIRLHDGRSSNLDLARARSSVRAAGFREPDLRSGEREAD
jgi:hypothetical protein